MDVEPALVIPPPGAVEARAFCRFSLQRKVELLAERKATLAPEEGLSSMPLISWASPQLRRLLRSGPSEGFRDAQ